MIVAGRSCGPLRHRKSPQKSWTSSVRTKRCRRSWVSSPARLPSPSTLLSISRRLLLARPAYLLHVVIALAGPLDFRGGGRERVFFPLFCVCLFVTDSSASFLFSFAPRVLVSGFASGGDPFNTHSRRSPGSGIRGMRARRAVFFKGWPGERHLPSGGS